MQRTSGENTHQDTLAVLDNYVSHLFMGKDGYMEFHLPDEKSTSIVTTALNTDSRLKSWFWFTYTISTHQQCHPKNKDNKCHVIHLNQKQIDALWGKGSYTILRDIASKYEKTTCRDNRTHLTNELVSIATSNVKLYQQALRVRNSKDLWCMLQSCLVCQSPDACKILLNNASTSSLDQAILVLSIYQVSALSFALKHQPADICRLLINRISDAVLQRALLQPDHKKGYALTHALAYQPPDIGVMLINRLTRASLDALLALQDGQGWTFALRAAWLQHASVFTAMIKHASPVTLAKAICVRHTDDKESTIEVAARYQTHDAFKQLLLCIHDGETRMIIDQFFQQYPDNLFDAFERVASFQSAENCKLFLEILCTERQKELLQHCTAKIKNQKTRFALRALQSKLGRDFDCTLLKPLIQFDAEKSAEMKEEKNSDPETPDEQQALEQFKNGAGVKIIRHDKDSDENKKFVNHLDDPTIRQAIRKEAGNDKQGYKAQLRPGEIKESKTPPVYTFAGGYPTILKARSPAERIQHKKTKPPQTLTTKHPVTYISRHLNTALFGSHANREMVGYAFTIRPKNIRLLMTQDSGTYERWWYNSNFQMLFGSVCHRLNILCQSFAEFVKRIDEQPYVVNEALVKLGFQDLFAIVIAKDTPRAREIAVEHRMEFFLRFQKDLPILFYDPERQYAGIYTTAAQLRDFPTLKQQRAVIETQLTTKVDLVELFDRHVSHVRMDKGEVKFHFADKIMANFVCNELKKDARLATDDTNLLHESCHSTCPDKKCHTIRLQHAQIDMLWGNGSYTMLYVLDDKYKKNQKFSEWTSIAEELTDIAKSPTKFHQQLIRLCSGENGCLLQTAVVYQSVDRCKLLINSVTDAALNQVILQQRDKSVSVLHTLLYFTPSEICEMVVNRLTEHTLNLVLSEQDIHDMSVIRLAARLHGESVFSKLVTYSSPETLAHAICLRGDDNIGAIEQAAEFQSNAAFQQLLQQIDSPNAREIINTAFNENESNLVLTFNAIALFQSTKNCVSFLALLDADLHKKLIRFYEENIIHHDTRYCLRALQIKYKKSGMTCELIDMLLNPLVKHDAKHSAEKSEEKKSDQSSPPEEDALQTFRKGAFVQLIQQDKKEEPEQKQKEKQAYKALFYPASQQDQERKTEPVYTFPGGFPVIVKTRSPEEHKQQKTQHETCSFSTRRPVTYVSPQMTTALSYGDEVVAYAYIIKQEDIRLLLTHDDALSPELWWRNKELHNLVYIINTKFGRLCKTFTEFVKLADDQPYVVNKAYVKSKKQTPFAIIITKDTHNARQIAVEQRLEQCKRFQTDLPILFYNPEYQHTAIYTPAEQRKDFPELFLAQIKQEIDYLLAPNPFGFFVNVAAFNIRIDFQNYTISKESARKILDAITKNEKTPELAFAQIANVCGVKAKPSSPGDSPGQRSRSPGLSPGLLAPAQSR